MSKNVLAQVSPPVNPDPLDLLVDALAERVAVKVVSLMRPAGTDWISHTESPLGPKRQPAIVRRCIARGLPGACIVGRDFLLSPEALQEELAALSRRKVPVKAEPSSVTAELTRELRKVGAC